MTEPSRREWPVASLKYITGEYGRRCPGWHQEDSAWKAGELLRVVPPEFWQPAGPGGVRILDVGCGAGGVLGHLTALLRARGLASRGVGVEFAEEPLAIARESWPDLEFRQQDVADVTEEFDVGLLMDVVEHVENPWKLIRDAAARCRRLAFHIPLDDSLLTELAGLYAYKADAMGHIHFYTRQKALWLLESCGLEIVASRLTRPFATPSSMAVSLKHRLLALPRGLLAAGSPILCARILGGMSLMVAAQRPLPRIATTHDAHAVGQPATSRAPASHAGTAGD